MDYTEYLWRPQLVDCKKGMSRSPGRTALKAGKLHGLRYGRSWRLTAPWRPVKQHAGDVFCFASDQTG